MNQIIKPTFTNRRPNWRRKKNCRTPDYGKLNLHKCWVIPQLVQENEKWWGNRLQREESRKWRKNTSSRVQKSCSNLKIDLIYKDETMAHELLWDLTDEIDCAETDAVGLLRSLSPFISLGFPLSLSIASWHMSLNHSSSGSSLATEYTYQTLTDLMPQLWIEKQLQMQRYFL